MPETPADTIRRAATLMRQRAQAATPGPWHIGNAVNPTTPCNIHTFPGAQPIADDVGWLDAEHIAAMHPDVAALIADWLAFEALRLDETAADAAADESRGIYALDISRTYLGETP